MKSWSVMKKDCPSLDTCKINEKFDSMLANEQTRYIALNNFRKMKINTAIHINTNTVHCCSVILAIYSPMSKVIGDVVVDGAKYKAVGSAVTDSILLFKIANRSNAVRPFI